MANLNKRNFNLSVELISWFSVPSKADNVGEQMSPKTEQGKVMTEFVELEFNI